MRILFSDKARGAVISSLNESLAYPASNLADVFLSRPFLSTLDSDTITLDAGEDVSIDSIYLAYCNAAFVAVQILNSEGAEVYSATVNVKRPIETLYFTAVSGQTVKLTVDLDNGLPAWLFDKRASVVIGAIRAAPSDFWFKYPDNPAIADGGAASYTAVGGTWSGGVFTKTASSGFGNASLKSNGTLGTGARISFFAGLTTREFAIGFNEVLSGAVATLDYALRFDTAGNLTASESGVSTSLGTYLTTDRFNIFYDGNNVQYLKNSVVLRTVAVGTGKLFYFDSDWNTNGAIANTIMFRVNGLMYAQDAWATADGWTPAGATTVSTTAYPGALRVVFGGAATSAAFYVIRAIFTAFTRAQAGVFIMRIRRLSGTATSVRLHNSGLGIDLAIGVYPGGTDWVTLPMTTQSNWNSYTGSAVTSLRFYVSGAQAGDTWDIDWIYIGDGTYILSADGTPRKFIDGRLVDYNSLTGNLSWANSAPAVAFVKMKGVGFGVASEYSAIERGYGPGRQTSTTSVRSPGGQVMRNVGPVFRSFNPRVPKLDRQAFRDLDELLYGLGTGYPTYLDLAEDTVYHEDPVYAEITGEWTVADQGQNQSITIPFLEAK